MEIMTNGQVSIAFVQHTKTQRLEWEGFTVNDWRLANYIETMLDKGTARADLFELLTLMSSRG